MLKRQRILLYLIKELTHKAKFTKTAADKMLFLLLKEYSFGEKASFYSFYPYRFGPFSQLFYYDLRKMESAGCLESDSMKITALGTEEADRIEPELKGCIGQAIARFPSANKLIDYVYARYPDYTVKSELKTLAVAESPPGFYTIGYEGKNIDSFLDILIHNQIQEIIDVRHTPFSMNFTFAKAKLAGYLNAVGIRYVHMPELGIPGEYRKSLNDAGDYERLFEFYGKNILGNSSLEELAARGRKRRVALLCMEQEHTRCHRGVISKALGQMGFEVVHL